MQNVPKVLESSYAVKIDGRIVHKTDSLKSARRFLDNSSIVIKKQATIVRINLTETIVNEFTPIKITKTLLKRVA